MTAKAGNGMLLTICVRYDQQLMSIIVRPAAASDIP